MSLGYLFCLRVSDPPVEVLPLQYEKVLSRFDDAALGGDGPGCVDVVPGDHTHSDASLLALMDGFGYLFTNRVLHKRKLWIIIAKLIF
jgi:hypothetical protein